MRALHPLPSARPPLWAYGLTALLAGPFILCIPTRRRPALVDLFVSPGAAETLATLAPLAAAAAALAVLGYHFTRRQGGTSTPVRAKPHTPGAGLLRPLWHATLAAALAWLLALMIVPVLLAASGTPSGQIQVTVKTTVPQPTRACPYPVSLIQPPDTVLTQPILCLDDAQSAQAISSSTGPTAQVLVTGWGNRFALFPMSVTLAP